MNKQQIIDILLKSVANSNQNWLGVFEAIYREKINFPNQPNQFFSIFTCHSTAVDRC